MKSVSLAALQRAVQLRLRECVQALAGLETLSRFFQQIVDIDEMPFIRAIIADELLHFSKAKGMTDKREITHKTPDQRVSDAIKFLGKDEHDTPIYYKIRQMFWNQRRVVSPEVIIMWWAFQRYKRAFVAAYYGLGLVFDYIAKRTGWDTFKIDNVPFLDYLERSRVEAVRGESRISIEEKNLLQFLVYGNLAGKDEDGNSFVPAGVVEKLMDKGVNVICYGYICEVLDPGFFKEYRQAQEEFIGFYHYVLRQVQPQVNLMLQFGFKPEIQVEPHDGSYWFPFLRAPEESWQSGSVSGEILLRPFPQFPIQPRPDQGTHIVVCSRSGRGKTVLMGSIMAFAIQQKGMIILQPIFDDTNQQQYSVMPLFPYNSRTQLLHSFLTQQCHINPRGIPVLILNVVSRNEMNLLQTEPLTKHDRIVLVKDHGSFQIDYKKMLRELKKIALEMGYKQTCGIIGVRDLHRMDINANVNLDLRVASNVLNSFEVFRTHYRKRKMMMAIDEIAERAPSHYGLAGSDQSTMTALTSSVYRRLRRKNTSSMVASQRVREFHGEIRDAAGSVLFRDLAKGQERQSSQIDQLLDILECEDGIKAIIKDYVRRGTFSKPDVWFWWYYNQPTRKVELLWAIPPPYCLEDIELNGKALFKKYEEYSGINLLVDDVNKVPIIMTESETETGFEERYKATLSTRKGPTTFETEQI
jgi:hypothetical protein